MIRQAIAATLVAIAGADTPRAGRIDFDIPPGPAFDTLVIWSHQAHMQMLFDFRAVEHAGNTNAVRGELDKFEGLRRMTAGTRVQFDIVNDRTVAVSVEHF